MNIIMRFLINGLVLLVIDWLLDSITIKSYGTALLAVFILSIMNLLVRPILQLITLPITILTFGCFLSLSMASHSKSLPMLSVAL
ncbi:phage holin family protein [Peribacillus frigoritolerans]|nr:phage holin family protein [Peribacillus frigoritolerans]